MLFVVVKTQTLYNTIVREAKFWRTNITTRHKYNVFVPKANYLGLYNIIHNILVSFILILKYNGYSNKRLVTEYRRYCSY